jgi:hypothetical protein
MQNPQLYEICIDGFLPDRWVDWFDGMTIRHENDGKTTLSGVLVDQAALIGLLYKLQSLNLTVSSICKKSTEV